MTSAETPQNTTQWVHYLADKKPPVRVSTVMRLKKRLSDKQCSLIELIRMIKADPIVCLHAVSLAGELHHEKESEVTSIEHAINSLGVDRLEELIYTLPTLRLNPNSVAHKMYFRAVANSHHAATQARAWLQKLRGGMFAEESYLAAMYYGVGHWMLWHFAPLHMSRIQMLIRERKFTPEVAEKQLLGCTIASISKGLVAKWKISALAHDTLEQESPLNKQIITRLHQRALGDPRLGGEELRSLNHLIQQKFFPVKLANWLAGKTNISWTNESTMHLVDIINDYLQGDLDQTLSFLHQNCVQSAQQYHVVGTLAPATEMLMLPSDLTPGYKLTAADQKLIPDTVPKPPAIKAIIEELEANEEARPKSSQVDDDELIIIEDDQSPAGDFTDEALYNTVAQQFLKMPDSYTQSAEILKDLIQALTSGLGLERIAVMVLLGKRDKMTVAMLSGFEEGHPLSKSTHSLNGMDIFSRLYQKPSCLLVSKENRSRIRSMQPGTFSRHVSDQDYLMMSLFAGPKPIAVIYADREGHAGGTLDFHQEKFKFLCSAASGCLNHIQTQRAASK